MGKQIVDREKKNHFKVPNDDKAFKLAHCFCVLREWNRGDTYPWMRRRTANYLAPRIAWWASLLVIILHGWWASSSSCSFNFARGGALVVLISAAAYGWIMWHEPKGGLLGGGPINRFEPFHPLLMIPLLGALGTIMWGYGDMLRFGVAC